MKLNIFKSVPEPQAIPTVEWFNDRWYKRTKPDGTIDYYPSVTTKLGIIDKPFLAHWRGDIGNREADARVWEAQQRGKRIHYAWYILNQGGVAIYQPAERPNFSDQLIEELKAEYNGNVVVMRYQDEMYDLWKLKQMKDVMPYEVIAAEHSVFSDSMRIAGTIDAVLKIPAGQYMLCGKKPVAIEGGIYVTDLKTGKSTDQADKQTAAYAYMWEETTTSKVAGTITIHTAAQTKGLIPGLALHVNHRSAWHENFEAFCEVSKVWDREHKEDRPAVFDFPALIKM